MLTADVVRELRRPFAAEQIKWKLQVNPKDGDTFALVVAYLDARDIAERLDLVTGGDWSDIYSAPRVVAGDQINLECTLTVCGATRRDVGTVPPPKQGDDATKDLYSDAFKRAAVKFGVGAHLYRFPTVKAKAEPFGRSWYLTFRAKRELHFLTELLLKGEALPTFTEIKVSGDTFGADGNPQLFAEEGALLPEPVHTNGHGANGHQHAEHMAKTGAAAPADKLTRARAVLADPTSDAKPSRGSSGASAKQRAYITRLIGDCNADETTITALAALFTADLNIDGQRLFSDPAYLDTATLSGQAASTIIRELLALNG